ncbi:MAG: cytochrome b6-f complex subunit PetL [Nostocaceae cyanobacterium]|nr:cytochrome b6-f complex subunit PetL [Nostocaceae cyanobacterium]
MGILLYVVFLAVFVGIAAGLLFGLRAAKIL